MLALKSFIQSFQMPEGERIGNICVLPISSLKNCPSQEKNVSHATKLEAEKFSVRNFFSSRVLWAFLFPGLPKGEYTVLNSLMGCQGIFIKNN